MLNKPPTHKDYYSLKEVAEKCGKSVADLLRDAEKGKLELSVWFDLQEVVLCAVEYKEEFIPVKENRLGHVELNGACPVLPSQLHEFGIDLNGNDSWIRCLDQDPENLKLNPRSASLVAAFEKNGPFFRVKYCFELQAILHNPELVITPEEKKRFEKNHGHSMSGDQEHPELLAEVSLLPIEEKLMGKAAIASYLRCSESSVKGWMKKKGLPHKKEQNRRVSAFPSELAAWQTKGDAKKKTS